MVNRPSQPEIITVNSERLQGTIRDLLPSQNGFGSELQASNVITPIIDLTPTAEGSALPGYLQTSIAFGSQTAFNVANANTTIISTTGFYRIFGVAVTRGSSASAQDAKFQMTDGLSVKTVWEANYPSTDADEEMLVSVPFDFNVFLAAGESISANSTFARTTLAGSTRQIATGDGTLVQPNGFPL